MVSWSIHSTLALRVQVRISPSPCTFVLQQGNSSTVTRTDKSVPPVHYVYGPFWLIRRFVWPPTNLSTLLLSTKAVGESRVPVSRPKASSPGRKKLMLDTRKYKIFALFMWKLELPVIWDFPYSCRLSSQSQSSLLSLWWSQYLWLHYYCVVDIFFVLVESDESRLGILLFFSLPLFAYFAITVVYLCILQSTVVLLGVLCHFVLLHYRCFCNL